ncbi:MAG: RNA 2',3'-cyclic phosphodiesterase [Acidimicrobiia bacterium]
MERLFVAVWPPADIIEQLRSLPRKDQRGVRFIDPENWHITLRFLGDVSIESAGAALDLLDAPAAIARLGPGVDLLGGRNLIVPVAGLDFLAADVRKCTGEVGEPDEHPFRGHLTIAKVKPRSTLPSAMGAFVDLTFTVHEVALVSSRLHPDGARYTTLETWPLQIAE